MQLKKAEEGDPGAGAFLPPKTRSILGGATCSSVSVRVRPVYEMHPIPDSETNDTTKTTKYCINYSV